MEFHIIRNRLRLKRYRAFDWRRYFLQIFALQLALIFIWLVLVPSDFKHFEAFELLGLILIVIFFVCIVLTPIITFWYKYRIKVVSGKLNELIEQKNSINSDEAGKTKNTKANND